MAVTDIVTPDYLRTRILDGVVTLLTERGTTLSDDGLWAKIDEAVGLLESEFGLALRQTQYSEDIDRTRITQFSDEGFQIQTSLKRPIQQVNKLSIMVGNLEWYDLPKEWVWVASSNQGQVHIIPSSQGPVRLQANNRAYLYTATASSGYVPGMYAINYRAGFEKDLPGSHAAVGPVAPATTGSRTVTVSGLDSTDLRTIMSAGDWVLLGAEAYRVASVQQSTYTLTTGARASFTGTAVAMRYDADILQFIGYSAAMGILASFGAVLYGAGVTGTSLTLDGMSQSNSINPRGVFANLIDSYREKVKNSKEAIYSKYAPVNMAVMG
jgi:hypothetical protein